MQYTCYQKKKKQRCLEPETYHLLELEVTVEPR